MNMEEDPGQRIKRQREKKRRMEESRPSQSPSISGNSDSDRDHMEENYSSDSATEAITRISHGRDQKSNEQNDTASSDGENCHQDDESASSKQGQEDYGDDASVEDTAGESPVRKRHNATMPTMDEAPRKKSTNSTRKLPQSSFQQPQNDGTNLLHPYGMVPKMQCLPHYEYQPTVSMTPARPPTKYVHVTVKWDPSINISCTISDSEQTVQAFVATFLSGLGDASLELLWQRVGRKSKDGGAGVILSVGPTHNLVLERALPSPTYVVRQGRQKPRVRESGALFSGPTLRIGAHCIVSITHANEPSNSTKGVATLLTPSDAIYDLVVATHPCDAETIELTCQGSRSWTETSVASFIGSAESEVKFQAERRYLPAVSRKRARSHSPEGHSKRNESKTESSNSPSTNDPPANRRKGVMQIINHSPAVTSNENVCSPATSTTLPPGENNTSTTQPLETNAQPDTPYEDCPIGMYPDKAIAEIEKHEAMGRLDVATTELTDGNGQGNLDQKIHVFGSNQSSQVDESVASSSSSQEDEGKESSSDISEIEKDEVPRGEAVVKSYETNEENESGKAAVDLRKESPEPSQASRENDEGPQDEDADESENNHDTALIETANDTEVFVEGSPESFSEKPDVPLETDNTSVSSSDSSSSSSSTDSSSCSSSSDSSSSSSSGSSSSNSNGISSSSSSSSSSDSSGSSSSSSNSSGNVKSQTTNGNEERRGTVPTPKPFSSAKAPTSMTAAVTVSSSTGHRPKHRPLLDPKQKIVILPTSRRLSYT